MSHVNRCLIAPLSGGFHQIRYGLSVLLFFSVVSTSMAQTRVDISLKESARSIPVSQFLGKDKQRPLFLWLMPDLNGLSAPLQHTSIQNRLTSNTVSQQYKTATKLVDMGYSVWLVDLLHDDASNTGLNKDLAELIQIAAIESNRDVVLVVGQLMANTALEASRHYQVDRQSNQQSSQLAGVILFSPVVYAANDLPGEEVDYADIVYSSNISSYIIQADKSSSRWRANELVEVLRSGGAKVFLHRLAKVQEGFYWRSDQSLSEADFDAHQELPFTLGRASRLLAQTPKPAQPAPMNVSTKTANTKSRRGLKALTPYPAKLRLPELGKFKITGEQHDIEQHHGKVVLLSFWASWCLPCIQELPALRRLYDDLHSQGLDVVTVNAGEEPLAIQAAADKYQMNDYTLLMDLNGTAIKDWNVYGYPSNFLLNKSGEVVYGSVGPIRWDDSAVRAVVKSLLD